MHTQVWQGLFPAAPDLKHYVSEFATAHEVICIVEDHWLSGCCATLLWRCSCCVLTWDRQRLMLVSEPVSSDAVQLLPGAHAAPITAG